MINLCFDGSEIQTELRSKTALSLIQGKKHDYTDPGNMASSLNIIEEAVIAIKNSMSNIQSQVTFLRDEKVNKSKTQASLRRLIVRGLRRSL